MQRYVALPRSCLPYLDLPLPMIVTCLGLANNLMSTTGGTSVSTIASSCARAEGVGTSRR
jgi:hypothetical protein